jgi:2'-hydroxyisoflavone reductase
MRILALGGTRFVGRHIVEAARRDGHEVTVFNRGRTPLPWDDVEHLPGDRETGDLAALHERGWDACIDVSGYLPQHVRASAALLSERVARYVFVSTESVYTLAGEPPLDESAALHDVPGQHLDAVAPELYGPLKVACEREAERACPGRTLILRPGIVAGPHDPTNRFGWWVESVARGGEVLAPGMPGAPVQLIDARDLAEFAVALMAREATGIFNVCGAPATFGGLLGACREGTGSDATLTWVSEQRLLAAGIEPFDELPLWVPDEPDSRAFYSFSNARARAAGLALRPLAETACDTWAWLRAVREGDLPEPVAGGFVARGLAREREAALLAAQHVAQSRRSLT